MSYLAPALAALFAGLTAYVKRLETLFFWASSILVLSGVGAFFASKSITSVLIWNWMIAYGAAASLFMGPYILFLRRRQNPASRLTIIATIVFVVVLLVGVAFDVYVSRGNPTDGFNRQMNKALGAPAPSASASAPGGCKEQKCGYSGHP